MAYLSQGSRGEDVRKLQTALNRAGSNLTVDGIYGPKTTNAVRNFQVKHNIKPFDGIAGPKTLTALEPYMMDYSLIATAIDDCLEAICQLPEFKRLEVLIYGKD